jgi:6-phosphofructokinase 1
MKRIGVLTSGGDAPGMNAAVRAVVRAGIDKGWTMFGVRRGFSGLIEGDVVPLGLRDVGGIIQHGGTVLGTSRCEEFKTKEGLARAHGTLLDNELGALVVIGGNGSQTGSCMLSRNGFPVVGISSTIDNDLWGTEISIGVDSALNVALEAIDRLKVTASSHRRAFLVEVMGRNSGYLALIAGITGGAEVVVIPEVEIQPDEVANELRAAYERGKAHAFAVVAEGARYNARALSNYFNEHKEEIGFQLRVTTLGHVQRGGIPGAFDRLLATRFGIAAIDQIDHNRDSVLIGLLKGEVTATPLEEVISNEKKIDLKLFEAARILAR